MPRASPDIRGGLVMVGAGDDSGGRESERVRGFRNPLWSRRQASSPRLLRPSGPSGTVTCFEPLAPNRAAQARRLRHRRKRCLAPFVVFW